MVKIAQNGSTKEVVAVKASARLGFLASRTLCKSPAVKGNDCVIDFGLRPSSSILVQSHSDMIKHNACFHSFFCRKLGVCGSIDLISAYGASNFG